MSTFQDYITGFQPHPNPVLNPTIKVYYWLKLCYPKKFPILLLNIAPLNCSDFLIVSLCYYSFIYSPTKNNLIFLKFGKNKFNY